MRRYEYGRSRSELWITVYENDNGSYTILTDKKYTEIISYFFSKSSETYKQPIKWKDNETYSSLWLPKDYKSKKEIGECLKWFNGATQRIWLGLNKYIDSYFNKELDFCIASDFNIIYGVGRTEIGEAEYKMKYRKDFITKEEADKYNSIIMKSLIYNYDYLPIKNKNECYVTSRPAESSTRNKLAWIFANKVSNYLEIPLLVSKLDCIKPQMKELSIQDKINTWKEIYNNGSVKINYDINGKTIIVIDDLYQSGVTMWQYASFLKKMGAKKVFGNVCVKSLKDSDNV